MDRLSRLWNKADEIAGVIGNKTVAAGSAVGKRAKNAAVWMGKGTVHVATRSLIHTSARLSSFNTWVNNLMAEAYSELSAGCGGWFGDNPGSCSACVTSDPKSL